MPRPLSSTIDKFYGMVQDRNGIEIDKREFYDLVNTRNRQLQQLRKRDGGEKYDAETHANGTKCHGVFTFVDDAGTELYIKINQDGKLYKHTGSGGTWAEVGTGFTAADAFFAQLSTRDTGVAASATGTLESSDSNSITDNDAAYTKNVHTGRLLEVNSEKKLVAANSATRVFLKERFDDNPAGATAFSIYPRAVEFFFANGTNFYKCDGTTLTQLDNSVFAYAFTGIVEHTQRLFGWKGTRLHWSDAGVGEHFSRNAWQEFSTPVKVAKKLKKMLLIYERKGVTAQFGDNPDNYYWEKVLDDVGTLAPKSVATYSHLQFFLDPTYGVCVLSAEKLAPGAKLEPLSVSKNFINNHLLDHTAAQLAAACAEVSDGKYHLCVDDDWYVLHIEESLQAPRDEDDNIRWIWTRDDRPSAMDANVLGHFGTALVAGAQASGTVYHIEKAGALTDDGTAITRTIEKRDWQVTADKMDKIFWSLRLSIPLHASAITESVFLNADSNTFGSADATIVLNTATSFEHEVKVPSSLSAPKDKGKRFSFKLEEVGSLGSSPVEEIVLNYHQNAYY